MKPKIYFTVYKKNGRQSSYSSLTSRRIGGLLASGKFKASFLRGRLVYVYGKAKSVSGKLEVFDNEMVSKSIPDLRWANIAFNDKDLYL